MFFVITVGSVFALIVAIAIFRMVTRGGAAGRRVRGHQDPCDEPDPNTLHVLDTSAYQLGPVTGVVDANRIAASSDLHDWRDLPDR